VGAGELMLQGLCIDAGQTAVLEKEKMYFLFPNGPKHYYVSKFANSTAHKGCFQSSYFQVIKEEQWPPEPEIKSHCLDPKKVYIANLIWRKPGYKEVALKEYYIKPRTTHCNFYKDSNLTELGGCFPLHWFTDFVEAIIDESVIEIPDFDIDFEEYDLFSTESEPKITKYEQLSLFDF
jgi:hypothetical protein